jgi:hypothetical protein
MREFTRTLVEAHPNLKFTNPFNALYPSGGFFGGLGKILLALAKAPGLSQALEAVLGSEVQRAGWAGALLPFPLNALSWGLGIAGEALMLKSVAKSLALLLNLARRVFDWAFAWTGLTHTDHEPKVPDSDLTEFYNSLLNLFNRGSVLERANVCTWSNGCALLSSVQNHLPGAIAAQKQPWMASLGCDASVWTTCPWPEKAFADQLFSLGTFANYFEATAALYANFFEPYAAICSLGHPLLPNFLGHNGPNAWTGSYTLPFVVQHENVLVSIYSIPLDQRLNVDNGTHAWFPSYLFDEIDGPREARNGAWMFGRKGAGFVALYSAQGMEWENDEIHEGLWASGARNVWICIVDRASDPRLASFEFPQFVARILETEPDIHGYSVPFLGLDLHGSVAVPQSGVDAKSWPRLSFSYEDRTASFDGRPLALDEFPRFENRYVSVTEAPPSGGVGAVPWSADRYFIHHPDTSSWVMHDCASGIRRLSEDESFAWQPKMQLRPIRRFTVKS